MMTASPNFDFLFVVYTGDQCISKRARIAQGVKRCHCQPSNVIDYHILTLASIFFISVKMMVFMQFLPDFFLN